MGEVQKGACGNILSLSRRKSQVRPKSLRIHTSYKILWNSGRDNVMDLHSSVGKCTYSREALSKRVTICLSLFAATAKLRLQMYVMFILLHINMNGISFESKSVFLVSWDEYFCSSHRNIIFRKSIKPENSLFVLHLWVNPCVVLGSNWPRVCVCLCLCVRLCACVRVISRKPWPVMVRVTQGLSLFNSPGVIETNGLSSLILLGQHKG